MRFQHIEKRKKQRTLSGQMMNAIILIVNQVLRKTLLEIPTLSESIETRTYSGQTSCLRTIDVIVVHRRQGLLYVRTFIIQRHFHNSRAHHRLQQLSYSRA